MGSLARDQNHGLRLSRESFTDGTQTLGRFKFHRHLVDMEPQRLRQLPSDCGAMIFQLGPLENHSGIHVRDSIALRAHQVARVTQEHQTVAVLPAWIGVGKVHTDIAQSGRAKQRIGDGVRENIGVGMAFQSKIRWNDDAAQNHWTARGDAMDVPALADAETQDSTRAVISSARNSRARSMSDGLVIFRLRSLPGTTLTST